MTPRHLPSDFPGRAGRCCTPLFDLPTRCGVPVGIALSGGCGDSDRSTSGIFFLGMIPPSHIGELEKKLSAVDATARAEVSRRDMRAILVEAEHDPQTHPST